MQRKNLQQLSLKKSVSLKTRGQQLERSFLTSEGIDLKPVYSKEDLKDAVHLNFAAGIPPFLRGPLSTGYALRSWTLQQYTGFSTAAQGNAFYRGNLAAGQKGVSLTFDLPTQQGYDSDHKGVASDVGKAGLAIDSVEDMKLLLQQLPLGEIPVSMSISGAVLPILAFFIVAAEEQGVKPAQLSGTIQKDISKELIPGNTYIYPPTPSMKILSDIFEFTSKNMPQFNSIRISGYQLQEAGATCDIELAYTLAQGLEYLRKGLEAGMEIDSIAPRISFYWGIGMNHFMEIAKMRAARMLWATLVKQFNPKNEKSLALRAHSQTGGWSLTQHDPFNNVARTCIEAAAAVFGGTQSLHTTALEEAIALPPDVSARIARNTQLYLQEETKITKTVDPWAGSFYLESLTKQIAEKAWGLIEEVEDLGGMTKATEGGIPKLRIEQAAAVKQARIDNDTDSIVGKNKFRLEKEVPLVGLEPENQSLATQQIRLLQRIKAERNTEKVSTALHALTQAAKNSQGNLVALAIDAARQRATLGEISDALEEVFGRYKT